MHWLIAEDDSALGGFLQKALACDGRRVELSRDGEDALQRFLEDEPALLILDLDLPSRSGAEVLSAVRERSPLCPVLVLSGRANDETRIACLNLGADDCLQKPFSLGELRARCGALSRRQAAMKQMLSRSDVQGGNAKALQCGALVMERMERRVRVAGDRIHLTNREFALLEQLLLAHGAPLSRSVLCDLLWDTKAVEAGNVDAHLVALRRKLHAHEESPRIETVRGTGFRLHAPVYARRLDSVSTATVCA